MCVSNVNRRRWPGRRTPLGRSTGTCPAWPATQSFPRITPGSAPMATASRWVKRPNKNKHA
eukprot:1181961-Prorocentrum_minimum.AAC.3